ncbi:hypothetical protein SARC_12026 [Sphaeroforma arctica JP610]|uniref:Uncharacterized protein n=1 Tax=Sphaeroforma arctica JP610 TaxID=667725 RepID=A0A0L0FFB9_9EUKA|nr:hypothetical protein SARC_12026 [Sphaeroforma arctica JP610]KNC75450.1 hypothetical protein SARC_12026 [Sphaeroforma arctica JP610]|eukprot:XP_014149352.1 hypothetical protein SARC_12026 [Sphaeroforma arctica JP610]
MWYIIGYVTRAVERTFILFVSPGPEEAASAISDLTTGYVKANQARVDAIHSASVQNLRYTSGIPAILNAIYQIDNISEEDKSIYSIFALSTLVAYNRSRSHQLKNGSSVSNSIDDIERRM